MEQIAEAKQRQGGARHEGTKQFAALFAYQKILLQLGQAVIKETLLIVMRWGNGRY